MHTALIVDDVAAGREIVGKRLGEAGFALLLASDEDAGLRILKKERPDLVVATHRRPGFDAIELSRSIRRISDVPVVVVAASPSISECEAAIRAGANRFLRFQGDDSELGELARELVTTRPDCKARVGAVTREQARAQGQRELRTLLQRLVIECRGNIAEIARRMGRDRSTVRYHLRRMNLLE